MRGSAVNVLERGRNCDQSVTLPKSTVLVHVGLARTGTTWLQKHLFAQSPYFFVPAPPSLPPMERVKQLGRRLSKDADERLVNELDFDIDAFRRVCEAIEVPVGQCAVISSERLSGSVLSGGFDRAIISRRIKAIFPQARILLVIREQRALLMSMYIQYLKYGGWHTIRDFISPSTDGRLPCFSPTYLMYDRLIKLYQDTFGEDNVLVLPFELFATAPRGFVQEICSFAGVPSLSDLPISRIENARRRHFSSYVLRKLTYRFRASSANAFAPSSLPKFLRVPILHALRAIIDAAVPDSVEDLLKRRLTRQMQSVLPTGFFSESNRRTAVLTGLTLTEYNYDF